MKKIYKTISFYILNFAFCIFNSFSQTAPAIEWQNTIGGSLHDQLISIQQTSDGGYILGGASMSNISGDKSENNWDLTGQTSDYWIVKTDSIGNIQWENTIGGSSSDILFTVLQTTDGGHILGGYSSSLNSGDKTEDNIGLLSTYDYWIVKTDLIGNIQWQNTIGGDLGDELHSIQETTDGGYILGGNSSSNISGDKTEISNGSWDYWLIKIDAGGNIQWQNTIGGSNADYLFSVRQTFDGGYILGGCSNSNMSGDKTENSNGSWDYWIVKTDGTGNIQWQNTIGGSQDDFIQTIQQTIDGGYIIGGYSFSNISGDKTENSNGHYDYWIVKLGATGNIQWQNSIGGSYSDALSSILQTSDSGYIIGGSSASNMSGDKSENNQDSTLTTIDFWVVKTDSTGNIQWENSIGGIDNDMLRSTRQTIDNGYILGGMSWSNISGDKTENCVGGYDYWIIKLYPDTITGISNIQSSTFNIQFSPNPLASQSTLIFNNPQKNIFYFTLYDITGCVVETVSTVNDKIILKKGTKQAGVYLFSLTNSKTGDRVNGKIIIAD